MFSSRSSEKGQALVLLVLAFVVLLGFAALALDGGMVYADRRRAQNGADASSLAGGGAVALSLENDFVNYVHFPCTDDGTPEYGEIWQAQAAARAAAISRAADNDFTIDADISDFNGVATQCGITDTGSWLDKYIDITATITSTTPTNFAHLIYGGPLRNRATAVTRVRPRAPLAFGNAIVALNPAACSGQTNGATFHGSAIVSVTGGGVFTNGCLRGDGAHLIVNVTDGSISYVVDITGNAGYNPSPQQVPDPIPASAYDVPPPACSDPAAHNVNASALLNTAQPLHGLYCVSGSLAANGHDKLWGSGVTLYMIDGGITFNGTSTIQITAPERTPNPAPAIPGLLIYLPTSNHSVVKINGTSENYFTGTILAPSADITIEGNTAIDAYRSQIIGWNVEVGGDAETYVLFDDSEQYSDPAYLELFR